MMAMMGILKPGFSIFRRNIAISAYSADMLAGMRMDMEITYNPANRVFMSSPGMTGYSIFCQVGDYFATMEDQPIETQGAESSIIFIHANGSKSYVPLPCGVVGPWTSTNYDNFSGFDEVLTNLSPVTSICLKIVFRTNKVVNDIDFFGCDDYNYNPGTSEIYGQWDL